MKRAYYYLFYKLYRFYEAGPSVWMSDQKAIISIGALEIWFYFSRVSYYVGITKAKTPIMLTKPYMFIPLVVVFAVNYFAFDRNGDWKKHVREFEKWPPKKNRLGGLIVWSGIVLILVNLIVSIYFLYVRFGRI
ncbi:hypothetical protein [Taibaiella soli]|nr:hypothetical protein [Taibaiella soli]